MEIHPVDLKKVEENAANLYEAIIVTSRRARQLNDEKKHEFNLALANVVSGPEDDFEEKENPDQLRIANEFDKRPKPHLNALYEFLDGKVPFRYKTQG